MLLEREDFLLPPRDARPLFLPLDELLERDFEREDSFFFFLSIFSLFTTTPFSFPAFVSPSTTSLIGELPFDDGGGKCGDGAPGLVGRESA